MEPTYLLQVSNHPNAGSRIPSAEAEGSWKTVYDGPIATKEEAQTAVKDLAKFYRHCRAFRGHKIGKLWFAILRTNRED